MDVLRSALGEETLTYFGASYGTKLGATYAELFPDRVGRFVLDGAVDVSLDAKSTALEQAEGFETALRAYVQNCLDSTDNCFLGDTVDEGLATISELLDSIEEEPLPAGDRELQVGNAFYGIITPLYNRDYWFLLSTALTSALDGQGSALMHLADAYASRTRTGPTPTTRSRPTTRSTASTTRRRSRSARCRRCTRRSRRPRRPSARIFAWGMTGCRGIEVTSSEEPLDIVARAPPRSWSSAPPATRRRR